MQGKSAPTARQRRLGAELRRLREAAELNASQASRLLGIERTTISNVEAGRLGVSAERVRSLGSVYQCQDEAYADALAAMAEERARGWWAEYRGKLTAAALDLAELEHHAVRIQSMQVTHLPGLLQTEEYARAVLTADVPEPTAAELRRALSFRMRRRDVLDRDEPPACTFLIHEAAARLRFGDRSVMRNQLKQILDASERETITIRVIPFAAGGFPSVGSSMAYVCGPVPQLDTVRFDTPTDVSLLDTPAALAKYRQTMHKLEQYAMTAEESRHFLHRVMNET